MQALAEMTSYLPVQGTSVPFYVHRFFEPSLAFAAGWNYWYAYAMVRIGLLKLKGIYAKSDSWWPLRYQQLLW